MTDAGFPRRVRLLTARDYKRVFDDAPYRASGPELLVLARDAIDQTPRLGVVVSKKNCRLAHQRNRFKRVVRESFRLQQQQLGGLDIIVLARRGIAELDNASIRELLGKSWKRILKKADASRRESPES